MLVGAGELVEQSGFAGILVAHQGKAQNLALRQGIAGALGMKLALLAQTGVEGLPPLGGLFLRQLGRFDGLNVDGLSVLQTQGELVPVNAQLHGIAHGGQLHHRDLRPGDHAHIQKMLTQGSFAPDSEHAGALPGLAVS